MNIVTKSLIVLIPALVGCNSAEPDTDLVWAVNVGGPAYQGLDGTYYEAEESVAGGAVEHLQSVKGTQDPTLYQSYRRGEVAVSRAMLPASKRPEPITMPSVSSNINAAELRVLCGISSAG